MPSPGLIHGRAASDAADRIRRRRDTPLANGSQRFLSRDDKLERDNRNIRIDGDAKVRREERVAAAQDPASEIKRGRSTARKQTGRYESSCAKSKNVGQRGQLSTIENRRDLAETTQYLLGR